MFTIQKRNRKYTTLVVFLAAFFLLFNGSVLAGEGGHESGQDSVHEAGAESTHEGGHGGDRSGDLRDLLYRFINFALLVIILFLVIKKAGLKASLSNRIEEIRQKLEKLKDEKEEAESKYQDIEKKLRDFEEEKKDIVEQFKKEGLAEKDKIIAEAQERAKQIVEQTEVTIQQEIQSATGRLKQEVVDLAAQKAQEIIAKEITDQDQDRLVDEFIERVEKIH